MEGLTGNFPNKFSKTLSRSYMSDNFSQESVIASTWTFLVTMDTNILDYLQQVQRARSKSNMTIYKINYIFAQAKHFHFVSESYFWRNLSSINNIPSPFSILF